MVPKWGPKSHTKWEMEWKRHANKWCRNWVLRKVTKNVQREGKGSDGSKKWGRGERWATPGPRRTEREEAYLPLKGGTNWLPARRVSFALALDFSRSEILQKINWYQNRPYARSIFLLPWATQNRFLDNFGIYFGIFLPSLLHQNNHLFRTCESVK